MCFKASVNSWIFYNKVLYNNNINKITGVLKTDKLMQYRQFQSSSNLYCNKPPTNEHNNVNGETKKTGEDYILKINEEIMRLKLVDETEIAARKKSEDDIRRVSDEIIRIKAQDDIKSKFTDTEKAELNKEVDDALMRIKNLEETRLKTKADIQKITEKLDLEDSKINALDEKLNSEVMRLKSLEDFKSKGETDIQEIKVRANEKYVRIRELEDYRVREDALRNADNELRKKNEDDHEAKDKVDEERKFQSLWQKLNEEESRINKLTELVMKEDTELTDMKNKLTVKDIRIKALEDFRVKDDARRKAEADTRLKTEDQRNKMQSEETQKYFVMLSILVTFVTSVGLFFIDRLYKKEHPIEDTLKTKDKEQILI